MPHVIRVPALASATAVQTILAGTRADDIALVFPLGIPCLVGTSDAMRGLYAHCRALQKDVVILGGDGHLRAVAVAAGFPAATSLKEWDATLPHLPAIASPSPHSAADWNPPQLSLVPFEGESDMDGDPFDPFNDMPPEFVLELMAHDGAYGAPDEDDARDVTYEAEPSAEDALLAAHERYEEHITRAIRHTGGLSLSSPTHPPIAPLPDISCVSSDDTGGDGSPAL